MVFNIYGVRFATAAGFSMIVYVEKSCFYEERYQQTKHYYRVIEKNYHQQLKSFPFFQDKIKNYGVRQARYYILHYKILDTLYV